MFITATMKSIEIGTPIHAGMSSTPTKRERDVVDPDAEHRRDRRGDDLPAELHGRREPAEVVDGADDGRDRGSEQHAAALAGEIEERERRHEDPEEDRETAETRDRPAVDPPPLGPVDGAEHPRHPTDRRRQQHDDDERDDRAVEDLRRRPQLVEHPRLTSSRTAGRLRRRAPGGCSPSRSARGRRTRRRCGRPDARRGRARCPPARR